MDKNKIALKVINLDLKHNLGLQRKEANKVIATLTKRKANFKSDDEWLSAIKSMAETIRINPLKEDIKKREIAVSKLCPVCGNLAQPITLMRNRKAYYCKQHRAVSPAIVENQDEE